MNVLWIIALIMCGFIALALYYSLKFPNGKWFGTRRDKLLRKTGPIATATLENLNVRFLTRAGGQPRLMLNALYKFSIKDSSYEITLPTESQKIAFGKIVNAITSNEFEREIPEKLELENGITLENREAIRVYCLEKLRERSPSVEVIYDKGNPSISTVRDWQ